MSYFHTYKKMYTRPTRLQDAEITVIAEMFSVVDSPITETIYIGHNDKFESWFHEDELMATMHIFADRIKHKDFSIEQHIKDFKRDAEALKSATMELTRTSKGDIDESCIDKYKAYLYAWQEYRSYILMPWAITYILDDFFVKKLKEKYSDWEYIYESLAVSSKPIQMQQLIEELLQWRIDGEPEGVIDLLVEKYGHLAGYSVNDVYWTEEEVIDHIREFTYPAKDLEEMKNARRDAKEKMTVTMKRLEEFPELLHLAKTIHEYIFLRTERIDIYKWALVNAGPFYRVFEKHFNLKKGQAGHMTKQEILSGLSEGDVPLQDELVRRQQGNYVFHVTPKKTDVVSDPASVQIFLERYIPESIQKINKQEVVGRVACVGVVRGKVRVILHIHDMDTMQEGEILIAHMTHPDYMSAIHKATAIVTDEGGIVCHAAIISRELKIPCVIGTGDATKVFKTGDIVEVDAEKGIVRKI